MASLQDSQAGPTPEPLDPASNSASKNQNHNFPAPHIIQPKTPQNHTHTCIFLHGLGSNGPKFGDELLAAQSSSSNSTTLRDIFPTMKFIFPTSRRTRSTIFKRAKTNQWFNVSSLDKDNNRDELAIDGLEETSRFIKLLIEEEVTTYGIKQGNIVLGGISQGFAASVYSLLTMEGEIAVGAFVGMSGWFPFVRDVERILGSSSREKAEDEEKEEEDCGGVSFGDDSDTETTTTLSKPAQVVKFIRENIGLPPFTNDAENEEPACLRIPVFLGHGALDEKISIEYGRRVRDALIGMEMDVQWKEYDDLGHWYKVPDEIDDIVGFLRSKIVSLA